MPEIVEGLIVGVGAGITVALILEARRRLARRLDRREQISFIRELVADKMRDILTARELPPPPGGHGPVPADHVRFAHFCELRDALDVALTSRVEAPGYKEVSSLRAVLAHLNTMLTNLSLQERKTLPLEIANSLRENLLELDWLGLPHEHPQQ